MAYEELNVTLSLIEVQVLGTLGDPEKVVKDLISELEAEHGKMIPVDDLLQKAEERGVSEEKVNEVLEKLKRAGDIFNPRHGFISKI